MAADFFMRIDVVDSSNRLVGSALRRDVLSKGLNFRTVHVILSDSLDRIIVQTLPLDHPRSPGKMGSSAAGYLRQGETYRSAAKRKVEDELGVTAQLRKIAQFKMHDHQSKKFIGLFVGKTTGVPKSRSKDIAGLEVHSIGDLKCLFAKDPSKFTETFRIVFPKFLEKVANLD